MNIETANRLLKYRKSHNLSQEELAEKIGVSRQAISKWERAEASPDTDNLILLAQIYGVTLDELLQGEGEPGKSREPEPETMGSGEPDKDRDYVKEDTVSFKNGIHVHQKDGDHVDINFRDGIHVDTEDGTHVHIDRHGVHVKEGEKTAVYTDPDGNVMADAELDEKIKRRKRQRKYANLVPVWLLAIIAFLIWGLSGVCHGFALSWICFLAIPLYYSLVDAVFKRDPNHFAYPVLCVALYMIFGFLSICGGWALGWIVFLTIPAYYSIAAAFKEK